MATQAEINSAKVQMDNAKSIMDSAHSSMVSWYDLVNKCKIKDRYLVLGEPVEGECQTGSANNHPGCAAKETCQYNTSQYNARVTKWESARDNYEAARDYYEELTLGKTDVEISDIEEQGRSIRQRYLIFGAITIVLIIAGVLIGMRFLHTTK